MILNDLLDTLRLSITPVILISGIGMILLSLTNRFGRIVDRTRQLSVEFREVSPEDQDRILHELQILSSRAKVMRRSNLLAVMSILFVSLIIVDLFCSAIYNLHTEYLLTTLFILSIISLIGALILLIHDLDLSLRALWVELPKLLK
jgi:Protein of unknown function (DUF2721)